MLISEDYRELNKQLHESRPDYGTSGGKWALRIEELANSLGAITILDYGCGKQTLGMALSHLLIAGYDPARPTPAPWFHPCADRSVPVTHPTTGGCAS